MSAFLYTQCIVFCPWETVCGCFNRWNVDGMLDAVLQHLRAAQIDIGAAEILLPFRRSLQRAAPLVD